MCDIVLCTVEVCMTSNLKVQTVQSYDVHHLKFWYLRNHPIIICVSQALYVAYYICQQMYILLYYKYRQMTKAYLLLHYQTSIILHLKPSHWLEENCLNYHCWLLITYLMKVLSKIWGSCGSLPVLTEINNYPNKLEVNCVLEVELCI